MNKEEILKKFWGIYDEYIQTGEKNLRSKLSDLLKKIEKEDKVNQILRPEKGWNKILAWQVLREQSFVFNESSFFLFEEEILLWVPDRNCDIFLTRIPSEEVETGLILRPGFKLERDDKREFSPLEWEETVEKYGITDERGLYLPLYEVETVEKFCFSRLEEAKESVIDYLKKMRNQ